MPLEPQVSVVDETRRSGSVGLGFRRSPPDGAFPRGVFEDISINCGLPGPSFVRCDANADEKTDLSDAVFILSYLFLGGPEPPEPYPACGTDETEDDLTCQAFAGCGAEP